MTKTSSAFASYLEVRRNVLNEIIGGLRGNRFCWGGGERSAKNKILKELGITLVTKTRAKKLGYEINPRAKSVGTCYFERPISDYCEVYVLECQCWLKTPKER